MQIKVQHHQSVQHALQHLLGLLGDEKGNIYYSIADLVVLSVPGIDNTNYNQAAKEYTTYPKRWTPMAVYALGCV